MYQNKIEGDFIYKQGRIAIIASRFNGLIVESLISGALDALKRHGVPKDKIDLIYAPGAYELPMVAQKVAQTGKFQGILALGAVIRGSTAHFELVAGECAKGLSNVALSSNLPVIFGVLTTDTIEQAIERAGTKAGNKGAETALALIETMNVMTNIEKL
ncbi:MAG: 6,7-dimethyl-8-ribityllumazine synthase [Francisellaceae bacterium]|jgi:6,7-dimethyl-8-ribityllumazine synthase